MLDKRRIRLGCYKYSSAKLQLSYRNLAQFKFIEPGKLTSQIIFVIVVLDGDRQMITDDLLED